MNNDLFCLKVQAKKKCQYDYYFRDKLSEIIELRNMLMLAYPKKLYSILKVRNLPILDLIYLDSKEYIQIC